MLKNSKHFVCIINEDQKPKMASLRHSGMAVNPRRNHQASRAECGQSNKTKTRQASSPRNSSSKSKHNRPWFTRLKAFEKSVYTPSAWCPFSILSMTKLENSTMKLCCMTEICGQMIGVIASQIIFSNQFPQYGWQNTIRSRPFCSSSPKMTFSTAREQDKNFLV
jgi:hypothetical protein